MVDRTALRARVVQLLAYAPPEKEIDEIGKLVEAVEALPPIGGIEAPGPAVAFVPLARSDPEE